MVALLGSSGSGKSTMLNLMAGLMKPTEGHIYIADQDIVKMSENKLSEFRRKNIGFIFQAYELITSMTVRENVELPLVFQSVAPSIRKQKALELLEGVGIPDKADLFPSQLSGGQQQRVSIARSLITEPSVIFADEPTGNLDSKTEEEIINILLNLNKKMKTTFIVVTHELKVAEQMQRIFTLRDGYMITENQTSSNTELEGVYSLRISDISRLAWEQVKRRKVVTGLCMAGISIGCAAIIVALSIGDSAQSYTEREINRNFKMDEITVSPNGGIPSQGGGSGSSAANEKLDPGRLTAQKLEIIKGLRHVTAAAPFQELGYIQMLTIDNKITDVQLIGTDLRLLTKYDKKFKQGGASDLVGMAVLNYGATVGLIDNETRQRLFEQLSTDPYNNKLMEQYNSLSMLPTDMYKQQVQLQSFDPASQTGGMLVSSPIQVVGILDNPSGTNENMAMYDKKIYVSLETGERLVEQMKLSSGTAGQKGVYNSAIVKVDSTENIVELEKLIQKLTLTTSTNLYQKEALADTFSMVKKAALGIGVFILIIASISIIVAMTMSTHQRRRQIGIMKVLGANMGQIRNMFITEAALLGMLGGLLGIAFSYLIVLGINKLIGNSSGMGGGEPLVIYIPLMTLPVGIAFAVMTGYYRVFIRRSVHPERMHSRRLNGISYF